MGILKGVIFDLDGVIVNTVPLHFKAWRRMFAEFGKKFTFRDYKLKVDGIPRMAGAKAILSDLPKKELEKAAVRKQKYFLEFLQKGGVAVHRDAVRLIKKLKMDSIKIAVISSSKNCRYILRKTKLDKLFEVVITGNDIKRGKPHPDIFLLAAKKLGLKTKECVVLEDAVLGIKSAKRAKMKAIGIDRYRKPQRLSQADVVVSSLNKLSIQRLKELASS